MKYFVGHKSEEKAEAKTLTIIDNDGNDYEIRADKFGGIEIIVNYGTALIEPHVSNHITIKTQK